MTEHDAKKVKAVTNFFTKDCIGSQTYIMGCLARAAAVEAARHLPMAWARLEEMRQMMDGIYEANHPIAEGVFDGKKKVDALGRFQALIRTFQSAIDGKTFTVDPFVPFLQTPAQVGNLERAIDLVGGSLRPCRSTAYGRLVASGKKLPANGGKIVDALLEMGIQPGEMFDRLLQDATGARFLEMPQRRARRDDWDTGQVGPVSKEMEGAPQEAEEEPGLVLVPKQALDIAGIFASVVVLGVPVFERVRVEKHSEKDAEGSDTGRGDLEVRARLRETWARGQQRTWNVQFRFPNPEFGRLTADGHYRVRMEGISDRFFLPRFIWQEKDAALQGLDGFLASVLANAVTAVGKRWGSLQDPEVSEELAQAIRKGLNTLPIYGEVESLIRRFEFEVVYPKRETVPEEWADKEAALTLLAEQGFDVMSTSKNDPGTIVTRAWRRGVPRYQFALNPFAPCLDLKRRPESRERRLALPLAHPIAPSVRSQGAGLPPEMRESQTELVCMIGDLLHYNRFVDAEGEEFGHDTGIVLAAGVEKLALARLEFQCQDERELEAVKERLVFAGISLEKVRVERSPQLIGDGLVIDAFRVLVEGPVVDIGKVKTCVGPFKFVMNALPHRFFAVGPDGTETEIEAILSGDTVKQKKALDALLYLLAAKAGIATIDPEFQPKEMLEVIRERLLEQGQDLDGREEIVAILPDGTRQPLGRAVVGKLPFYRPTQTGVSTFRTKSGENGVKVQTHALLMAGGIGLDVPCPLKHEFAELVETRRKVAALKGVRREEEDEQEQLARLMASLLAYAPAG